MPKELLSFEKAELEVQKQNSPLKEESVALLEQAKTVAVTDNDSLKAAKEVIGAINAQSKKVKELRLELTRPIDSFKKYILDAERNILVDLEEAKALVADQMLKYEERIEAERQAEAERVQSIVDDLTIDAREFVSVKDVNDALKATKTLFANQDAKDQELPAVKLAYTRSINDLTARAEQIEAEEKAEAERKRLAEEAKTQSEERQRIEAEKARIAAERQKIEDERKQLERQKLEQELEAKRIAAEKEAEKQAALKPKINAASSFDFTIDDAAKVPAQYLSPDEKKIRAAIKAGVREIPGVTITERKVVR